jgi:amino acid adenylation domain-containing protein
LATETLRWASELSEVDAGELPGDRPRSPRSTQPGRRHSFALSPELSERLESLARGQGHSQFAVALALFGALLYRFAGLRELLVGVPVAQRFAPSLTQAAGCLINFAPLRLRVDGQLKLRALVQQTAGEVGRLLQRQRVPFQRVAKQLSEPGQASAANPRIGFSHEAGWPALQLAGLDLIRLQPELTHAKLDLFLRLENSRDGWRGTFEYDADLFDPQTIVTLATRYVTLLEKLVEAPDSRVMDLPWLGVEEQRALLAATRGRALPGAKLLSALLAARLRSEPDLVAVSDGVRALTYADLARQAEAVGVALREAGVQRGECVVLYLESCTDWPVAVFGAWRAGAAIVPIDADQPRARQTHMFAIAQARVALSHARHCADLASFGVLAIAIDRAVSRSAANQTRASPDDWELRPDDLAFGIFTSGSTGLPKLALGNHGGLANKALAQLATFRLEPGVRVLQFASPAFDAALSELVLALSAGGTLWIPAREARYNGEALAAVMRRERIEVAMLTPSVVATLPRVELPELRLLLVVGERCPAELVDHWGVGRDVYNLYGPTETTIWATSEYCQANTGEPTIGRAIPNVWVYVLDRDLNLLGAGQTGEICIGGAAVGSGYKHASDSDRVRFLPDPYIKATDARIYRTGDRGHFLPDGRLVFVGRDDDQVKLFGRRIALGEIESALRHLEGVQEAVVVVHEQGTPRARLSAFVRTQSDDLSSTELRSRLRMVLPSPMIPSSIAIVEDWPRLISGKIDRKALALRAPLHVVSGALTSAAERAIAAAFSRVLGIDPESIGPDDDFFGLGGRSLDVVSLAEELDRVGVSLSVVELLQAIRVSELATLIEPDTSRMDVVEP